jgi:hypothetical protein
LKVERIGSPDGTWCLILAIWGRKYGSPHVNALARQARALSPGLSEIVLFTDHIREGIDPGIRQTLFPPYFHRPEFFGGAYRAKLAVFSRHLLPPGRRCLFVDLDTIVLGDLGRIAALVVESEDCFMMPPAGLGFGPMRKLTDRLRPGMHFPVGNSSLVAFHSDAKANIAEAFEQLHAAGVNVDSRHMIIDDVFISWFARNRIKGIPKHLAVSFRREFMARSRVFLLLRKALPSRRKRREGLVAVTLNGMAAKPENLVTLAEGSLIRDSHGRVGIWSDVVMGPARQRIIAGCRQIVMPDGTPES